MRDDAVSPNCIVDSPFARKLLITEALRGEGASVVDDDGYRFYSMNDKRGSWKRDGVSRAFLP